MDFGKVKSLTNIDLSLPKDHPDTGKLLKSISKKKTQKAEVYVGLAKWGIPEWVGTIYPPKTREKEFRINYVSQFNCIELNPTHYKFPRAEAVKEWRTGVGKDFKFCPKFYKGISHYRRLKDSERMASDFCRDLSMFENNLGPAFIQMPPNFTPKSFPDLKTFITDLPSDVNIHFELRHPEWYSNEAVFDELYNVLKEKKIGFVITDTAGRRDLIHQRLSTPEAFIRFVGNSLHDTDYKRIDEWVLRICKWIKSGLKSLYFIMHMHEEKHSPELGTYTIKKLNEHCKLNLKEPVFYKDNSKIKTA